MNNNTKEMFYNKPCNEDMRPIADICEQLGLNYVWSEFNNKNINSSDMIYIQIDTVRYMRIDYKLYKDYYYVRDTGYCYETGYDDLVSEIMNLKRD